MALDGLLEVIAKGPVFHRVQIGLKQPGRRFLVTGLTGGALSLWLAALYKHKRRSFLVVVPSLTEAQRIVSDMQIFSGDEVCLFPAREEMPGEVLARSPELEMARLAVLSQTAGGRVVLVVPWEALVQQLTPPLVVRQSQLSLQRGQSYSWDELLSRFEYLGYQRQDLVENQGQYSVRGGLVDIFPSGSKSPYRMEFFGEEICSLRGFNPESQRSMAEVEAITVGPAREVLLPPTVRDKGIRLWREDYEATLRRLESSDPQAGQSLRRKMEERLERARLGLRDEGLEDLLPYFYPRAYHIWDYLEPDSLMVLVEPARIADSMEYHRRERAGLATELLQQGRLLPRQVHLGLSLLQVLAEMKSNPILGFASLPRVVEGLYWNESLAVPFKQPPRDLASHPGLFRETLQRWKSEHFATLLIVSGPQRAKHLAEALRDDGIETVLTEDPELPPGHTSVTWGGLSQGAELPEDHLAILTEYEIYGNQHRSRPIMNFREGVRLNTYTELKDGDYVVHIQHGVGRYQGIHRLNVGGVEKDYLLVQYAGQDRLYVPVEQLALVHKYIGGGEERPPKLSRLSGGEWARVKSRVKNSVQDLAKDLLQLYAARETVAGHAYSEDTVWQRQFEEAFPYRETPDQLRAIAETKADMQKSKPMDRLLCGDVGYGKTEVALRAAFRAVMEGKQVAFLVPTTVLAQQHFRNFKERFAETPVQVDVLSRFRSAREQQETVRAVALGKVDVVIGTHRLLSRDVKFKELGLLIIDEEQRFGVSHKERIKQLRSTVDVLTLTATPIPRTLHMSLVGVRDMSLIETAPEDRYPVQTYVVEFSDQLVREAVLREVGRGGQVYFVHNRIADIGAIAQHIAGLVPEARVAVGHGRLREDQLERIMVDFTEGMYDVLVCTTIVENGLDIPNVNTLIVDEADNLGLAQLYQLRGRVGRSSRLAYAYFTYHRDKAINQLAEKRLAAIREFTALGSGFKIALRDLELRGAGNLLGSEQHGHMQAVGFNLYCQLLEEAVRNLKEGRQESLETNDVPSVDLNVDAYLEESYIPAAGLKMEFYQRLLTVATPEEVQEVENELRDRFGEPPAITRRLITMAYLRTLAKKVKVSSIQQQGKEVLVTFEKGHGYQGEPLLRLAQRFPRRLSFNVTGSLTMRVKVTDLDQIALLDLMKEIFQTLNSLNPDRAGTAQEA